MALKLFSGRKEKQTLLFLQILVLRYSYTENKTISCKQNIRPFLLLHCAFLHERGVQNTCAVESVRINNYDLIIYVPLFESSKNMTLFTSEFGFKTMGNNCLKSILQRLCKGDKILTIEITITFKDLLFNWIVPYDIQ